MIDVGFSFKLGQAVRHRMTGEEGFVEDMAEFNSGAPDPYEDSPGG